MGICASSDNHESSWKSDPRIFVQKIQILQKQREEESEVYQRKLMMFAFREGEWKRERKKLREEVKRLRKSLEEKQERINCMEVESSNGTFTGKSENLEKQSVGSSVGLGPGPTTTSLCLVERMKEERARRDEAVEKWKMLYLAIKHELDDLIKRTHEGTLYWRADGEDLMEELQKEVKAKDETIQALKAQIASMEDEDYEKKREVDILRQSLRILSSNKSNKGPISAGHMKNLSKPSTRFTKKLSKLTSVN